MFWYYMTYIDAIAGLLAIPFILAILGSMLFEAFRKRKQK